MSYQKLERVPISELDPDELNLLKEDLRKILFEKKGSILRLREFHPGNKRRIQIKNKEFRSRILQRDRRKVKEWRNFIIKNRV